MTAGSTTGLEGGKAAPIGVCFAGAGMVAELHHRAAQLGGHIRVAGLVEPRADLARQRAEQWGVPCYPSLAAALGDEAVQAVFVLTPSPAHEETALAALAAGRPVLVEKPVAEPDAIARIEAAAASQGLTCMPGHNYAYDPEFTTLRRLVRSGDLGPIRAAWITYIIRHPEEVARHYGAVLDEVMVHHTYLAQALFGVPGLVYAGSMEPAWQSHAKSDQAWVTWHYPGGLSVHLFASFAVDDETSDPWLFQVKVLGERGGATYNWRDSVFHRPAGPLGSLGVAIPAYDDSYIHEQAAFAAAAAGNPEAIVSSLGDARQVALLVRAAREADASRAAVTTSPDLAGITGS